MTISSPPDVIYPEPRTPKFIRQHQGQMKTQEVMHITRFISYKKYSTPGARLNVKITSHQHRKSHFLDETIIPPSKCPPPPPPPQKKKKNRQASHWIRTLDILTYRIIYDVARDPIKVTGRCQGTPNPSLSGDIMNPLHKSHNASIAYPTIQHCVTAICTRVHISHDDVIKRKHFVAFLALCAGNSTATGEFLSQRPVTRSFDVDSDLRLNKRLSNWDAGDLRRHCAHYDITAMCYKMVYCGAFVWCIMGFVLWNYYWPMYHLQLWFSYTANEFKTWMSNCIQQKLPLVITYPGKYFGSFNGFEIYKTHCHRKRPVERVSTHCSCSSHSHAVFSGAICHGGGRDDPVDSALAW